MTLTAKPVLSSGQVHHLRVDSDQAGRRLDNLLLSLLNKVPKSHIYKMLRRGEVRLNGRRAKPETRVEADDLLRLPPIRLDPPAPEASQGGGRRGEFLLSQILYEDDSFLVINKPAGMVVHGGTGQKFGLIETLRNARGQNEALELVHRLDRDTSGCLMISKSMRALRRIHEQLRAGAIAKRYRLLASGQWDGPQRTITASLRKDTRGTGEAVVRVDERDGKHAVTHFSLERQYGVCCLLSAEIETGRTHQIRVHASDAGFPLAGDEKYGDKLFNAQMRAYGLQRLFLHAAQLRIPAATGGVIAVDAPLPEDLQGVLAALSVEFKFSPGRPLKSHGRKS